MKLEEMSCIDCAVKRCDAKEERTDFPEFCVTTHLDPEVLKDAMKCYEDPENHKVMVAAAEVEYEHYCKYTRVEEIMEFARKIGQRNRDRHLRRAFERKPDPCIHPQRARI